MTGVPVVIHDRDALIAACTWGDRNSSNSLDFTVSGPVLNSFCERLQSHSS